MSEVIGEVVGIKADRGFCFAQTIEQRDAIFVHAKSFPPGEFDVLVRGDRIAFTIVDDSRAGKPCGIRARLLYDGSKAPAATPERAPCGYVGRGTGGV